MKAAGPHPSAPKETHRLPLDRGLEPPLVQVAFSVVDLAATERWFREGLGFRPAGGSRRLMRGPLASAVQGLPGAASTCGWLVDANPWFQLELFQFERPLARLMAGEARPCDIGYTRIAVWVRDFDQSLTRLAALGSRPPSEPVGPMGARRVCMRNPDGVFVEVVEDDPLSACAPNPDRMDCPVALRAVTLSVRDLASSEAFFCGALGLRPSDAALRAPEHEALWGLAGARTQSRVLRGGSVLLELVQYLEPLGKPRRADYRICDQGILNIAFGARSKRNHTNLYRRARAAGARPNRRPLHVPGAGVVYVNDPQHFSVELLWMSPASDKRWGFTARPLHARARADTHAVEQTVCIAAPLQTTWTAITDHEGMHSWIGRSVKRVVDGESSPDGRGSERLLKFPGTAVTEQVLQHDPPTSDRCRVTRGSPFTCHQGQIRLQAMGDQTVVSWTIRFRPRLPGTGRLLAFALSRLLSRVLHTRLQPHVEAQARKATATENAAGHNRQPRAEQR